jgi:hypothetical protein
VHTLRKRKNSLLALFLIQVSLGAKVALLFWKLLILEFLLGISETFLYVVSALQGQKLSFWLDVLQQVMLFVATLTYWKKAVHSIISFNGIS